MNTINRATNRVSRSTAILTILLVICGSLCYNLTYKEKIHNYGLDSDRVVLLCDYIENGERPDVVFMGSSLVLWANYQPDRYLKLTSEDTNLMAYLDCRYFKQLLEKSLKKKVTTVNLAFLASTPADCLLITKGLIENKRTPSAIVYGIAPRAMADNHTPCGGAIGGKAVLNIWKPGGSEPIDTLLYLAKPVLSCPPILNTIREYRLTGDNPNFNQTMDFWIAKVWSPYKRRSEIKSDLNELALALVRKGSAQKRQLPALEQAGNNPARARCILGQDHDQRDNYSEVSKIEKDLVQYNGRYNPPNFEKLKRNGQELESLLSLCKRKDIKVFLVEMPLTQENRELIKPELNKKYNEKIESLCRKYGSIRIEVTEGFNRSDFIDSAHLNGKGGKKFQEKLVSSLKQYSL